MQPYFSNFKRRIIRALKKITSYFFVLRKIEKKIIFESTSEISGNSFEIYKHLLLDQRYKEYKVFWAVKNAENIGENKLDKDTRLIEYPKSVKGWIKFYWFLSSAQYLIYENKELLKLNNRQYAINLTHGTPIKDTKTYLWTQPNINYVLYQSEFVKDNAKRLFKVSDDKLVCLGYPRNDALLQKSTILKTIFYSNENLEKLIVWLPTFRHRGNTSEYLNFNFELGIPIFKNEKEVTDFNELLKGLNTQILIKLHPGQLQDVVIDLNLSNIRIIDDEDLSIKNITLYELLGKSDALITDYSSVYFDYLITDKLVALTIDDREIYSKNEGFAFENVDEILIGDKLSNLEDLKIFVLDVKNNHDRYANQRYKNKVKFNKYGDCASTERVFEFIFGGK